MKRRERRVSYAILLSAIVGSVVTGCVFPMGLGNVDRSSEMMGSNLTSEFSATDIMFAQMMIPHHQQAVDMAELAATRAGSEEVKSLARQIASEQEPEISQMQRWLDESGAAHTMDHDMGMGGMLSEEELEALEQTEGVEFDRLFLEGMIAHHRGALDMAQMVTASSNAEVRALAESIITSQTEQIAFMERLLGK